MNKYEPLSETDTIFAEYFIFETLTLKFGKIKKMVL